MSQRPTIHAWTRQGRKSSSTWGAQADLGTTSARVSTRWRWALYRCSEDWCITRGVLRDAEFSRRKAFWCQQTMPASASSGISVRKPCCLRRIAIRQPIPLYQAGAATRGATWTFATATLGMLRFRRTFQKTSSRIPTRPAQNALTRRPRRLAISQGAVVCGRHRCLSCLRRPIAEGSTRRLVQNPSAMLWKVRISQQFARH
mmetsp:Transcript_33919/g.77809  ORF Transcript_33919/g.77809 Transcript_33919/m.77809 type:complete len:202 (-) Transcript_33919:426-1031(-)